MSNGTAGGSDSAHAALAQIKSLVYAVRLPDDTIKIGFTSNLNQRRAALAHEIGFAGSDVEILAILLGGTREDEARIHERLKPYRVRGREYYRRHAQVWAVIHKMRKQSGMKPYRRGPKKSF